VGRCPAAQRTVRSKLVGLRVLFLPPGIAEVGQEGDLTLNKAKSKLDEICRAFSGAKEELGHVLKKYQDLSVKIAHRLPRAGSCWKERRAGRCLSQNLVQCRSEWCNILCIRA